MVYNARFSRRYLMRSLAGGALTIAALPVLGACDDSDSEDDAATNDSPTDDSTTDSSGSDDTESASSPTSESTESADSTETPADAETPQTTPTVSGGSSVGGQLTVYSGRGEDLVQPIIDRFSDETGIEVQVRYGGTSEMAAAILEEGSNTPADVFYGQDAGALGALSLEGMTRELPSETLERVESRFRSRDGMWVGTSGRARVVVYNTEQLTENDIPSSILDFADSRWENMLGWAPTNGSFQAWVTALRVLEGDQVAREWLESINALNPLVYEGNSPIVRAAISGEVAAGFVNHYYLHRERAEAGGEVSAENYVYRNGDPGALINVAGVAILEPSQNVEAAELFADYLLREEAQEYFSSETFEYPLISSVSAHEDLVPLSEIETPDIDLSNLQDLEGTLAMLQEVGLI